MALNCRANACCPGLRRAQSCTSEETKGKNTYEVKQAERVNAMCELYKSCKLDCCLQGKGTAIRGPKVRGKGEIFLN